MGPKYVHCSPCLYVCRSDFLLVFAKDEIVFARTSPKHKLEIGQFSVFHSHIDKTNRNLSSQTRSGIGSYRRGVSKFITEATKILIRVTARVMVSMILLL